MLEQIKIYSKANWPFFTVILLFLVFTGYYVFSFDKLDGHIELNQIHNTLWDTLFPYITYIGDGITAVLIIIGLFIWKEKYGYIALFAFLFTTTITHGLKFLVFEDVMRPKIALWDYFFHQKGHTVIPFEEMKKGNSFPSGHTTSAMSIFCLLSLIFSRSKNWLGLIFASLAILASISRVYLSEHFLEDVFFGTIIGVFGTLLMFSYLIKNLPERFDKAISLKRTFDLLASLIVLLMGLPFFILISIAVFFTSKGGIFFSQTRVGKDNIDFKLLKFRTMKPNSESAGQITVGGRDPRITKIGYILRKFKLDEFPQLINILKGEMSIIGPRPEVRRYVSLYNQEQLKVLSVSPGLSDYASLEYINENEILGKANDPEQTYIEEIMPAKLTLNLKYISDKSLKTDLSIIFRTIGKIFK